MSCHVPSCPVLPSPTSVMSCPAVSCPAVSCPVQPCPVPLFAVIHLFWAISSISRVPKNSWMAMTCKKKLSQLIFRHSKAYQIKFDKKKFFEKFWNFFKKIFFFKIQFGPLPGDMPTRNVPHFFANCPTVHHAKKNQKSKHGVIVKLAKMRFG